MKFNALILIENVSERARQPLIFSIKLHTCVTVGGGWIGLDWVAFKQYQLTDL